MTQPPSTPDPGLDQDDENAAVELDEDRLGVDPLEQGVEPPERYSGADKWGTTPYEMHEGQDLEHRLQEERPDLVDPELEGPSGAGAAAPDPPDLGEGRGTHGAADEQLLSVVDDSTEDEPVPVDPTGWEDPTVAARHGKSADVAGGAMADTIRTPDPEGPDET